MDASFNHGSAKIYQFPTERVAVGLKRQDTLPAMAALGSSWYHEEAVQESARAKSVIVPIKFPRQ